MTRRDAKIFLPGLILIYLLAATTALIVLSAGILAKLPDQGIGSVQGAILGAYARADAKLFYLETAARQSVEDATDELYSDPASFFTSTQGDGVEGLDCGAYTYPLWNAKGRDCLVGADAATSRQRLLDALRPRTLDYLSAKTSAHPSGGFSVPYTLTPLVAEDRLSVRFSSSARLEEPIFRGLAASAPATTIEKDLEGTTTVQGLSWPGKLNLITSCFGPRSGVKAAASNVHHGGIDIAPSGEVLAAADGEVMNDPAATQYGVVWVKHSPSLSTGYIHLDKATLTVRRGDIVKRGTVLGMASNTGCAAQGCPVHIHFEVLVPQRPSGEHTYPSLYAPGWYTINPLCAFPEETVNQVSISPSATNSCALHEDPKHAYCEEYGLTLTDPQAGMPGTAVAAKKEGESAPTTVTQTPVGPEPKRPTNTNLDSQQQAKFQATEQNRYKYGWEPYVVAAAAEYGVDAALIKGVITQESLGDPHAISGTGCAGIMQICYATGTDNLPGLSAATMQTCGYGCKYGTCKCTEENDRRFRPEISIPAGTAYLARLIKLYSDNPDRVRLAVGAYNVGQGIINRVLDKIGRQSSWDDVAAYLKKHPETITYDKTPPSKANEVIGYVPDVMAYAVAWNGDVAIDEGHAQEVKEVKKTYGDISHLGTFTYSPDLVVDSSDTLTPYANLLVWADTTLTSCAKADRPGDCLLAEAAKAKPAVKTMCEEDAGTRYLIELAQALRDCSENRQANCACALPAPPMGVTNAYRLAIDARTRTAILTKDGAPQGGLDFGTLSAKTIRVGTGMGIVPGQLSIALGGKESDGKEAKPGARLIYTEFGDSGEETLQQSFDPGWALEKGDDTVHAIFRKDASGAALCSPIKTQYSLCSDIAQGMPTVKFALTLKDVDVPAPVTGVVYDNVTKKVSFSASVSPDVAFYNVYAGDALVLQLLSATPFDATCFVGQTVTIKTVDRAGNEGEGAPITIAGTPSCAAKPIVDVSDPLAQQGATAGTAPSSLPPSSPADASLPSSTPVQPTPDLTGERKIAVLGNSHIVGLKQYLLTKNDGTLVLEDTDSATTDKQGCVRSGDTSGCDDLSYVGRNLLDMEKRLPQSVVGLKAQGVTTVIVYEGANSLSLSETTVSATLTRIVAALKAEGFKVYVSELPVGVIGSAPSLTAEKVAAYNSLIKTVGADGTIALADAPWLTAQLHGYAGPSGSATFDYFTQRFEALA